MGRAPVFVERVLDAIVAINRAGTSILLVEQNAAVALGMAHRANVLAQGRIELSGSARSLLDDAAVGEAYLGTGRRSAREGSADASAGE